MCVKSFIRLCAYQNNFSCVSGQATSTGPGLSNPRTYHSGYVARRYRRHPHRGGTGITKRAKVHAASKVLPMLTNESIYIGVDIGKFKNVAGFISRTLLERHQHFENCPAFIFEQSREGFRAFVECIRTYCPLEHCFILYVRYNQKRLFLTRIMYTPSSIPLFFLRETSWIIHNYGANRPLSPQSSTVFVRTRSSCLCDTCPKSPDRDAQDR